MELWDRKISLVNFFIFISIILFLIQIILITLIVPKSEEIARSLLRTSDMGILKDLLNQENLMITLKA